MFRHCTLPIILFFIISQRSTLPPAYLYQNKKAKFGKREKGKFLFQTPPPPSLNKCSVSHYRLFIILLLLSSSATAAATTAILVVVVPLLTLLPITSPFPFPSVLPYLQRTFTTRTSGQSLGSVTAVEFLFTPP